MPRKLPVITLAWLRRRRACREHQLLFIETFGDGARVEPSRKMLRKAAVAGLDIMWLARRLIPFESSFRPPESYRAAAAALLSGLSKASEIRDHTADDFSRLRQSLRDVADRSMRTDARPVEIAVAAVQINAALTEAAAVARRTNIRRNNALRSSRTRAADVLADALGLP